MDYEFDKKSNWTRHKKIQNGSVIEIEETDLLSLIFFKSL